MKKFLVTCTIECAQCFRGSRRFCVMVGEGYDSHAAGIMKAQMGALMKEGWLIGDKSPDTTYPGDNERSDAFCSKECYGVYCGDNGLAES